MRKLFFYFRLYFLLIGQYIKTRMQYRFDFFISTFGMLLFNLTAMVSIWILMSNIESLAGYSYEELVFIYAFSVLSQLPLQILFDNIWSLRRHVNQGTFIKYYFKPLNTLFYYLSEMIDIKAFGQFFFAIGAIIWASMKADVYWTLGKVLLFPVLITGSSLLFAGLMLIAASGCFWVKDSFSILSFVSGFRDYARYPMGIYNNVFKFIFTWIIPIGFVAFYPSQFYLRNMAFEWSVWLTPIFGAGVFWLSVQVWHAGTRAWGGTGS